jgi:PKD repeat protein
MRLTTFFLLPALLLIQTVGLGQICGTDYFLEKEYQKNPSFRNVVEQNWMISDQPATTSEASRAVDIIPVVFHIIHNNGDGNISEEQIESAVEQINADFRRTNADASSTRSIFAPYAADSEIEFRLAKIDPDGNCTNGIVRINDPNASINADNSVKGKSYWPSNKYFNIWVVNSIESSGVEGIILGYAQFPGSGPWTTYGVVIRNDRVGTMGTANSGDRTLSHEIGHCFNLLHTFQSGCGNDCSSSGDRVCDTPPVLTSTQGCNQSQNSCSNDTQGSSVYGNNVVDQIENYMSYDDCQNMFTLGQKSRMKSALSNISTLAQLKSTSNLAATGALQLAEGVCKADFTTQNTVACVGEPIQFFDQSLYEPETFSWEFSGGFPSTDTAKNPIVVYSAPGTYTVKLTVQDANNNSATVTQTNFITVISPSGNEAPYSESFETPLDLESMEWYADMFTGNFGWVKNTTGGSTGSNSLRANAFNSTGSISVTGPALDVSNLVSATVTFKYAYQPRVSTENNRLRVYSSSDCGATWKLKFIQAGSSMFTTSPSSAPYLSPQAGDWVEKSFSFSSSELNSTLRLRFEFQSDDGNNLFVDDINLTGQVFSTDVAAVSQSEIEFNVFPNPAKDEVHLEVNLAQADEIQIVVLDIQGRLISTVFAGKMDAGSRILDLDGTSFSAGVYLIQISGSFGKEYKRFVVQ